MWELDSLEFIHIHALQPTTINHASSSKLSIQNKKYAALKTNAHNMKKNLPHSFNQDSTLLDHKCSKFQLHPFPPNSPA